MLPENTFVGRLESDSSNILALIKRGYDYIASVVNFEVPIDDDIEFVISSNCSDGSCQSGQSCKCTDVELGEVYSFTVNMNAKRKSVLKNVSIYFGMYVCKTVHMFNIYYHVSEQNYRYKGNTIGLRNVDG